MRIFLLTFFSLFFALASAKAFDMIEEGSSASKTEETVSPEAPAPQKTEAKTEEEKSGIFSFLNFSFGKSNKELVLPSDEKKAEEEAKKAAAEAKPETEFERLTRTAEEGNVDSQMTLGYAYLYGSNDIKPDYQKAFQFYSMAAVQNDKIALNNLGSLFYSGVGTERDAEKAAALFNKAASLGNSEAAVNLAFMHLSGRDLKKNFDEAIRLFSIAAKDNNPTAQFMLSYAYYRGFVVKQNLIKAYELMSSAASSNYDVAQYLLAKMYIDGSGVTKNYGNAVSLLTKSTTQGNLDAMMYLGRIYMEGKIYQANPFHAYVLFNIAAVQNKPGAAENRDFLEKKLDIPTLLQAQKQAESFKQKPSDITTYIRQTFGYNIQNYISSNMRGADLNQPQLQPQP